MSFSRNGNFECRELHIAKLAAKSMFRDAMEFGEDRSIDVMCRKALNVAAWNEFCEAIAVFIGAGQKTLLHESANDFRSRCQESGRLSERNKSTVCGVHV